MRGAARRVLGLVLVGLLFMSVVGMAASETFINKTGKTVTGITITFSKRVMVTRHDSAFPDQSPNGRSQEFTFSGGSLRSFGRFNVSWMPSSGKVTDYEWIEKAQPAQEPQTTPANKEEQFKLPDPNTPPILYGDDYPGPDEPLYQPQLDEQIWLTDADGYGDIYDNDSIKISYAPGFDRSQITKIDVYRNGIKLRFVPETFDVLTNAQMKTFDGNPAEHSPASNHTDHAIMGYEYKFEIHTTDHVWTLTKTVKSGFKWQPKEVWAEMEDKWAASMSKMTYQDMIEFFEELKEDGFTGISCMIPYYMNSPYDNAIFELKDSSSPIAVWENRTPTLNEVETMLKAISQLGLETHIRSMIYVSQKYQEEQGWSSQSFVDPKNPSLFFESHTQEMVDLALTLEKYHVKLFTIYDEVDILQRKYPSLIQDELDAISKVYSGELGIDESTNNMLTGDYVGGLEGVNNFPKMAGKFWDWKDSQGKHVRIEYSSWVVPLESQEDQRVSIMIPNFVKFWRPAVDYYTSRYPNNTQMFGEVGVHDTDGVCLGNTYYFDDINIKHRKYDDQETADVWYAYLKGAEELGIESLDIWLFPLGDRYSNFDPDTSFLNIGIRQPESPAYRVIRAVISNN